MLLGATIVLAKKIFSFATIFGYLMLVLDMGIIGVPLFLFIVHAYFKACYSRYLGLEVAKIFCFNYFFKSALPSTGEQKETWILLVNLAEIACSHMHQFAGISVFPVLYNPGICLGYG